MIFSCKEILEIKFLFVVFREELKFDFVYWKGE